MTETGKLTLDGLLAKTPDLLKPIVTKYGPALAAMTALEFCDWLDLMLAGDVDAAWRRLLASMPNGDLLQAWKDKNAEWDAANERNAQRVALQKEAVLAVLKVLLVASLSWVGL
jgi:hypothetical protein